ncbi:methylmalonyl-CoA epimerase [Granulicella pectinivorans]|uniref:methylmalonyl-CoA epimerase n=1 Tax=Granulicella pectinivorans TaxID=474950 RepID=UPI001FEBC1F5|nr:methylmalonyl-CoA epimerase [Granulicella pectinivorans]
MALEAMLGRLKAGEVRAVARAISFVERGEAEAERLLAGCRSLIEERGGRGLRIGVTGAPGAGKSSLVDQMVRLLRVGGETVGVVAVDPSSPLTGGALLGDRIRMQGFSGDDGVLIRSMASRGVAGGVGRAAEGACLVMEAAGRDIVIVETVGVGQDEVAVSGMVDVVVLVLVPGMGDEVQALKAGVMEVADVFCVNKADRGGAEGVEAELVAMQGLVAGGRAVPVVKTVGTTGDGVADLIHMVRSVAGRSAIPISRKRDVAHPDLWHGRLALDHLGIAVREIDAARGFYEGLGLAVNGVETVEHEGVRVAMISLGTSRIELLEALSADTTIGRFLDRRGEGLHHVALRVEGIDAMFERLKTQGVRLVSDAIRVGAGGHRYFFVHPASTGGVLMELVEGGK